MIVNHSFGFIFVSNPKAASTSIETALSSFQQEPELDLVGSEGFFTPRHMPAAILRDTLGTRIWQSYLTFGVVRNPWDWFVSQFHYNLSKLTISPCQEGPFSEKEVRTLYMYLCSRRGVPWQESGCQSSFLCCESGEILVDEVLRFENLNEEFQRLMQSLGIHVGLPHLNQTTHRPYHDYYTHTTVQLIANLYGNDVQQFGYTTQAPKLHRLEEKFLPVEASIQNMA